MKLGRLSLLIVLLSTGIPANPGRAAASTPVPYWDLSRDWNPGQITLFNPDSLDGQNGVPVKAADLNGDGRSEVVVSAFNGDGPRGGAFRESAGEIHVFFWDGTPFGQAVDFARSDSRVLEIFGPGPGWYLGDALARGDVDGDGIDDVVVGAFGAGQSGRVHAGMVYVLFGDSTLAGGASIDLAQGLPPGMTSVLGSDPDDRLGVWSAVGDVNGDGSPDLVMGADRAGGPGGARAEAGKVVVLYGPIPRGTAIDLADTTAWSTSLIWGIDSEDHFGSTTECADLDGDGYADVVGAASAKGLSRNTYDNGGAADGPPYKYRPDSGETWIVWGGPALPDTVDLAAPPAGVSLTVIYGRASGALCGEELSVADVNGDGLSDLLVGSLTTDGPPYDYRSNGGEGYVFYGSPTLRDTLLDMASTAYPHLTVYGVDGSIATDSFTAGDVNGDGYDDLLVGMPHDPGPTGRKAGAVGVLYGAPDLPPVIDLESPPTPYTLIEGADHDDDTAYWSSIGDVDGDGRMDPIINAMSGGGPRNSRYHTGDARIVSGAWLTLHPAPPTNLSVTLTSPGNRARLSWSPSPTPETTGYRVLQGPDADHLYPSPSAVLTGTEAQVLDLPFYTPVTFAVQAVIGGLESRTSDPVGAKPGTTPPTALAAQRLGNTSVALTWKASPDPDILGYRLYRVFEVDEAGSETPLPGVHDLVTPEILPTCAFVDTTAPPFSALQYRVTTVVGPLTESLFSEPANVFTRPDTVGSGLLLVNDYNWFLYSDGPAPNYPADPYEMYDARAVTGSVPFDFWDMRTGWSTYPSGYVPLGKGSLDPAVLFQHAAVLWCAQGLDNTDDERISDLQDLLLGFHEAGGRIIFAGWLMDFYIPPEIQQVLNVVDWDRPVSVTPSRLLTPQLPGLTSIGPAPDVSSAFNCAVPVFGPGGGIYTYYRLNFEAHPPLCFSSTDSTGAQIVVISAGPSYLDPVALGQNMSRILATLGLDPGVIAVPDGGAPPPTLSPAFPNPSHGSASVSFRLDAPCPVDAQVYDLQGRRVRLLTSGNCPAGVSILTWDGRDDAGRRAPGGLYFVRVSTQSFHASRRVMLLP